MKLIVQGLDGQADRSQKLIALLKRLRGIAQVDVNAHKGLVRIVSDTPMALPSLEDIVRFHGFHLRPFPENSTSAAPLHQSAVMKVAIDGMTCRSCEIMIERSWKKIDGVKKVEVDAHRGRARIITESVTPTIAQLQNAIGSEKYRVKPIEKEHQNLPTPTHPQRPSTAQLVGLFVIVLLLGKIFSRLGLLQPSVALGVSTSLGAVFLLGLVAASSSCIAVAGGLLLSSSAKFNERYGGGSPLQRMRPVFLFIAGRLASYAILGAVIGWIGTSLTPSPFVTGSIAIVAALYMLMMGLDMLSLAPRWLKSLMPRIHKRFTHAALATEEKNHWAMPFLLGGATFFLPCGFTQALQLYALTTGSAVTSGLLLFAFSLGTAPALFALGRASGSLKGNIGQLFFRFSGALVVVLGLWNLQNGFTITGYPLTLPSWSITASASTGTDDPNVSFDGAEQIVRMAVDYNGYSPNQFTLKSGIPTKWIVDAANGGGCLTVLQAPQLGIRQFLNRGENVIEFTPQITGEYAFSCSMGMYRGQIIVVPNT